MPDPGCPEAAVLRCERAAAVWTALLRLPLREARAVRMRYGLGEAEWSTWPGVGMALGVSASRARQIAEKARARMRPSLLRFAQGESRRPRGAAEIGTTWGHRG